MAHVDLDCTAYTESLRRSRGIPNFS